MARERRGLAGWLDERLGITSTILPIITHPVPPGLDWSYVLGSATLAAFVIQVITGVALAMTYVPSTDAAFESIQFITHEALLGRVVRGIHFFGAGAMVTLAFAHLAQVFLIGAYKFPRELNWVSGSLLLLFTLALAFTGQLLRWEQDAYWSIVVAVQQAGKFPVLGDILMQLILAGWSVGPATLTRFYATHVFLLPALVFLFLGIHLYLVYYIGISDPPKPGHPVDPATYRQHYQALLARGEPFFPNHFFRDSLGAVLVTIIVALLAVFVGPPDVEVPADPTIVQAYPRPDWYFLWYFALLASVPRITETIVIIGFPILVGAVLLVMPFVFNQGERAPSRRPWAIGAVAGMVLMFIALTYHGLRSPWAPNLVDPLAVPFPERVLAGLSEQERRGAEVFQLQGCHACHAIEGVGPVVGPDLGDIGSRLSRELIITTILAGRGNMPGYGNTIPRDDFEALVAFLETLRREPPAIAD